MRVGLQAASANRQASHAMSLRNAAIRRILSAHLRGKRSVEHNRMEAYVRTEKRLLPLSAPCQSMQPAVSGLLDFRQVHNSIWHDEIQLAAAEYIFCIGHMIGSTPSERARCEGYGDIQLLAGSRDLVPRKKIRLGCVYHGRLVQTTRTRSSEEPELRAPLHVRPLRDTTDVWRAAGRL